MFAYKPLQTMVLRIYLCALEIAYKCYDGLINGYTTMYSIFTLPTPHLKRFTQMVKVNGSAIVGIRYELKHSSGCLKRSDSFKFNMCY